MSRIETATTIAGTMTASMASHILCCGLLPFAVNTSVQAFASHLGLQLGLAILTTILIASTVTLWEKHRHENVCKHQSSCSFNLSRHLLRNLVIGGIAYGFFGLLTHIPAVHHELVHFFDPNHIHI